MMIHYSNHLRTSVFIANKYYEFRVASERTVNVLVQLLLALFVHP